MMHNAIDHHPVSWIGNEKFPKSELALFFMINSINYVKQ